MTEQIAKQQCSASVKKKNQLWNTNFCRNEINTDNLTSWSNHTNTVR